jgi:CheY-like chemotaxis protein
MEFTRQRMLLVEDDRDTRTLLRRMLALCGWEVTEAASLREGAEHLKPPPDCLLLDLELPDGDGASLLRKVRYEGLPVRVVVHTGTDDPVRLRAVESLRPDAVLKKPLDSHGLTTICGVGRPAVPMTHALSAGDGGHSGDGSGGGIESAGQRASDLSGP